MLDLLVVVYLNLQRISVIMMIGEIVGMIFLALAVIVPLFTYFTMPEKMKSDGTIIILSAAATLCIIIGFVLVTEF